MTKLKDIILNKSLVDNDLSRLPKSLKISPSSFSSLWTLKKGTKAINKSKVLDQIVDKWNSILGDDLQATVNEIHIDRSKLYEVNTLEKVISTISKDDFLDKKIEDLAFSRAIAKIEVKGLSDEYAPSIALNINEDGDQIAYGSNVEICNNFTIMQADHIFSTYEKVRGAGGGYTTFDLKYILKQLKHFMQQTNEQFEKDLKQIEVWKESQVSRNDFFRFLGDQFTKIQVSNQYRVQRRINELTADEKTIPLTGLQLSKIAVEAAKPSYDIYKWHNDEASIWSIINHGTEILKFQNGFDSKTVLTANANWVRLVNDYFLN